MVRVINSLGGIHKGQARLEGCESLAVKIFNDILCCLDRLHLQQGQVSIWASIVAKNAKLGHLVQMRGEETKHVSRDQKGRHSCQAH